MDSKFVKGKVVATYKVGNTTIEINDSALTGKSLKDFEVVISNVKKIGYKIAIENSSK